MNITASVRTLKWHTQLIAIDMVMRWVCYILLAHHFRLKQLLKYHFQMSTVLSSFFFVFFFCFVALRPKSTAMVIAGRSVHLTTLFPGQA